MVYVLQLRLRASCSDILMNFLVELFMNVSFFPFRAGIGFLRGVEQELLPTFNCPDLIKRVEQVA